MLCLGCGAPIASRIGSGQRPRRCPPCRARRRQERAAASSQELADRRGVRCAGCGSLVKDPRRTYCSRSCSGRHNQSAETRRAANAQRKREMVPCAWCAKPMDPKRDGPDGRPRECCSLLCAGRLRSWSGKSTPIKVQRFFGCSHLVVVRLDHKARPRRCPLCPTASVVHIVPCVVCKSPTLSPTRRPRYCSEACKLVGRRENNRANNMRRRAAKKGVGRGERVSRLAVFERDRWRCGLCGKRIPKSRRWPHPLSAVVDHIVPLARHGEHTMANVQAAHAACNSHKRAGSLGPEQLRLVG